MCWDENRWNFEYIRRPGKSEKAGCMGPQMLQGRHFPGDPPADQFPIPLSAALIFCFYKLLVLVCSTFEMKGVGNQRESGEITLDNQ